MQTIQIEAIDIKVGMKLVVTGDVHVIDEVEHTEDSVIISTADGQTVEVAQSDILEVLAA